jgi:TolB-like protein/Tfp pilus assembly protein PilF
MSPKVQIGRFFAELKRRKVLRVAVAYIVGGWALAQGLAQVLPIFDVPIWLVRLLVLIIILGFPGALVLSWFFDVTRYGIVRTPAKIDISAPDLPNERSIAVLPFADLSPNHDHDYFSDGIAEEILGALAKIDNLRVAARRSSFWFKDKDADVREVAQRLNVKHVLEGSVRRDGNRVRVKAELIDARKGFAIWSDTFDREFQGIFAVQDEITCAIIDALTLKLDVAERPPRASRIGNTEAYDVYLQGLFWSDKGTEDALRRSLEFFERALQIDPRFSRAWTGVAKSWLWLADAYVHPREAYPKVRDAAENALKIDNEDAEAHVYLGETKRILDWDLDGAAAEFARAVELDPNSTPSNYFSASLFAQRGERDKALAFLDRTSKIDPASLWVSDFACELYRYFGMTEQAMIEGERALQLDPTFLHGPPALATVYRSLGRFDEAIALYEKAKTFNGRPGIGLAITYATMGRREEALRTLEETIAIRAYTPGDGLAHVYVALGEYEEAMQLFERACEDRSSSLHSAGITPEYKPIRRDKRFLSILRRIGIDPEKAFAASA